MKKITIIIMAALLPTMTFAQLKVDSNGKIGIGTSATSFNSQLSVGSSGYSNALSSFEGSGTVMKIKGESNSAYGIVYAVDVNSSAGYNQTNVGINIVAGNNSTSSGINCIGVQSMTGGPTLGRSVSISGCVPGTGTTVAGVYGSNNVPAYNDIDGRYAGVFSGNVKVTGTIDGTLVNSSDARLKENVQALDENFGTKGTSILEQLDMLTPVSFKYKKLETTKDETMSEEGEEEVEEVPNPVMEKEHFGLIAQELQKVYPNLVYEKDNGYLAVNYVELVPVLMQAIKELNAKVEELSGNTSARKTMATETTDIDSSSLPFGEGMGVGSMSQNVPNPFTEKTDIAIYLPESVQTATLYIYDLSGKQLEQHPVTGRGNTVMTIHADKMDAGMYVYSLVADKKVITTKKMIVTK